MKILPGLLCLFGLLHASCGGSQKAANTGSEEVSVAPQNDNRNRNVIPLATRIRRLPGMAIQNGVPVVVSSNNSIRGDRVSEPLYVVDGIAIANSFRRIQDMVQPNDVANIQLLKGADASFYGSRGSNGVIIIITKSAN